MIDGVIVSPDCELSMATRPFHRYDESDEQEVTPLRPDQKPVELKPVAPDPAQSREERRALIHAAIDEEWERMEDSIRYLADR